MPTNLCGIGPGPANVDAHVAADGPAQERQPLLERADTGLKFRIVRRPGKQHADAPHTIGLRPQRQRPGKRRCRRAADQRDERAPLHQMLPQSLPKDARPISS
jgi:hypothetical protein